MRKVLDAAEWRARARAHEARVNSLTAGHRSRSAQGRPHPVEDFLFTYYGWKPSRLRRWHPGAGVGLQDSEGTAAQGDWRFYRREGGIVQVDVERLVGERRQTLEFVRDLLVRTRQRQGRFGCFGLHEWAMVYRAGKDEVRHAAWPLRLGSRGTDAVVESHTLACSHFDAFRFFTPDAAPRNVLQPTRALQAQLEQPGCLHAGMDLYKWAMKLEPLLPSELVADCFELARDIRVLDMRASPYDLRELGYEPVRIETADGKLEYAHQQRVFSERSQVLRDRLVQGIDRVGAVGQRTGTA